MGTLRQRLLGASSLLFAVGFNVPYAILAATFDYPAILRRPGAEVLARFAEGGASLILTWYGFMAAAMLFVPLAIALSITRDSLARAPGAAVMAAIAGSLSGALQAVGLSRWIFVVPSLARQAPAQPGLASAQFDLLNAWGGVAIGEHLGQWLLVLFLVAMARLQFVGARPVSGSLALLAGLGIAGGTGEGVALALGRPGEVFSFFTIAGFLLFSLWLAVTGIGLLRGRSSSSLSQETTS